MDEARLEAVGRRLAERHREPVEAAPDGSLLNHAESARVGDWSLRSALVRFAQPEPVRAANLLELVRRLDAVLHHVARPLERHTVRCDRALGPDLDGVEAALGGPDALDPYPDTRGADLARVARALPEGFPVVLTAYEREQPLDPEERPAIPLLEVALDLDGLAATLTAWADRGPADPPAVEVDVTCAAVRARMDELGVPAEEWSEPARRGPRRRS